MDGVSEYTVRTKIWQLGLFEVLKDVPPLIRKASSGLTDWLGVPDI